MAKRGRKILLGVAAILVLLGAVGAYAISPVPIPEKSDFGPPLAEVRALAASSPGPLPTQLRSQQVASVDMRRAVVIASGGPGVYTMRMYAYQIVSPDRTILVDAVNDAETMTREMKGSRVFPDGYERMQQALRRASAIVVTHEHFDHSAGISHSPYFAEIAPRVMMTPEQLGSPAIAPARFTPEQLQALKPLRYEKTYLLAPGVVLVKAPGHTPGSQMVYVRLAGGQEFLLVGDIAWSWENIRLPRAHPRIVNWAVPEDGAAMANQLRYLHDLSVSEPNVHIVVAHDGAQMDELVRQGLVQDGLQ